MASSYGLKQLEVIRDIGKDKYTLHCGAFGTGKTYSIEVALGFLCKTLKDKGITGLNIVLLGKTQQAVKSNQCNVLSKCFGKDFRYDSSKKDGKTKDAVLFGQYIWIIGLNDKSSESRFRGITDIFCIIHDEAVLCTAEQFDFINGRLRGEFKPYQMEIFNELGIVPCFYIGSTNPDSPVHWLKKLIDDGFFNKVVYWGMHDARWKGSVEYYERLKKLYKNNDLFYDRYLKGLWVSAEGLVWSSFDYKKNVLNFQDYFDDEEKINYSGFNRVIIGVDWGSSHKTAFCVLGYSQGCYIVLRCLTFQGKPPSDLALELEKLIRNIEQTHKVDAVYVDGAGKAYNDELAKRNISYFLADKAHEKIPMVDSAFATETLAIMSNCTELINCIYSYKYKENSVDDKINRVDDDPCDGLRYGFVSDIKITERRG